VKFVKKVGIIPNIDRDLNYDMTRQLVGWITEKGHSVLISKEVADFIGYSHYVQDINEVYSTSDFLISLGGDGTLLNVARMAALYNTPIIGINLGTLGFLTTVEKKDAKVALEKVLSGEYTLEKRMMLEANILNGDPEHQGLLGLNDICITRGSLSRLINTKIYINDEFVDLFRGDGIILSTPTGSTAYNLSAGGPILVPDSQIMVITPICPHSLYSRSFVVSGDDIIKVEFEGIINTDIMLSVDGQTGITVAINDVITIKKSNYITTIIKTNKQSFYKILRQKIVGMEKE
jgi:NAD+ kinase